MTLDNAIALIFRGLPLLVKMALLVFIGARSMNILGDYGLYVAYITILTTLYGLESYNITNKLFVSDKEGFFRIYASYITLSMIVFLLSQIVLIFLKLSIDLGILYFVISFIAFIEFLLLEVYRILILRKSIIVLNVFFFIKGALWPFVVGVSIYYGHSLLFAFNAYLLTQFSILVGTYLMFSKEVRKFNLSVTRKIDFSLIDYVLRAVILRVNQYLDRFIAALYLGKEFAGVVVLITSLSSVLLQINEAIVVPKYFRKILDNISSSVISSYRWNILKTGLLFFPLPIVIWYFYCMIEKITFQTNLVVLILSLIVVLINLSALPYHHLLLSLKRSRYILKISVIVLSISSLITFLTLFFVRSLEALFVGLILGAIISFFIKRKFVLMSLNK